MFTVIGFMFAGMLLGYLFRKKEIAASQHLTTVLIWVLLFLLGIEVGSNENIIQGIHNLGIEALILTIFGLAGSILSAWALWKILYKKEPKKS